jgi:hypothetical protein
LYESYAWRADELDAKSMQVLELEQSGIAHFRKRDWATAAQVFNEAVSLHPSALGSPSIWSASPTIRRIRPPTTWTVCGP